MPAPPAMIKEILPRDECGSSLRMPQAGDVTRMTEAVSVEECMIVENVQCEAGEVSPDSGDTERGSQCGVSPRLGSSWPKASGKTGAPCPVSPKGLTDSRRQAASASNSIASELLAKSEHCEHRIDATRKLGAELRNYHERNGGADSPQLQIIQGFISINLPH